MAKRKKAHHTKRRRSKMSGIGGNIETAVYVAAGAIAGEFLINTVNTMFGAKGGTAGGSDYVGDAAAIAIGVMLPAMIKGQLGSSVGMGMVAAGALNIAQDAGLIAGMPMISGNYSNMPVKRLNGFQTSRGALVAGVTNARTAAAMEAMS